MLHLTAMIIASGIGYVSHLLLGDIASPFTDFMVSSLVSGVVYVVAIYKLKQLRGDF